MKKLLLLSTLISVSLLLNAQTRSGSISDVQRDQNRRNQAQNEQQSGFQRENLRFGGNFGLRFGTITFIDVSPAVGYQFTNRFLAGVGVTYNYYRDRRFDPPFTMSVIGGTTFAQFAVIQIPSMHFFLRAEYSLLNQEVDFFGQYQRRDWVHYPMVGGGILLPFGRSSGVSIQLMWDLIEKDNSIFPMNPIIRMGFMFGL
ncbi:MAG: hypothetical protein FWC94_00675 [Bacteroidales bacterium]|nr:hypothetical protein [Bacteroidales bacterium]